MTLLSRIPAAINVAFTAPVNDRRDPQVRVIAITLGFLALVLQRLAIPSKTMFDEIHYLPAARRSIHLTRRLNPEHPLLAKEFLALSMRYVGDTPFGWRLPSALLGTIGLYAAMRAMWWASLSRSATVLFGPAAGDQWVHPGVRAQPHRDARYDNGEHDSTGLLAGHAGAAEGEQGRILVLRRCFLGLSLGAKWNWRRRRWRCRDCCLHMGPLVDAEGSAKRVPDGRAHVGPITGVSLLEAALRLGAAPAGGRFRHLRSCVLRQGPAADAGMGWIHWQRYMLELEQRVKKPHLYMSRVVAVDHRHRPIWLLL